MNGSGTVSVRFDAMSPAGEVAGFASGGGAELDTNGFRRSRPLTSAGEGFDARRA